MIVSSLRAALIAAVGATMLLKTSPSSAGEAAITLTAVTVGTEKELRLTLLGLANLPPKNCFAMLRQRALAGGTGQRQRLRGTLEPALVSEPDEGRYPGTLSLPTAGFLSYAAFEAKIHYRGIFFAIRHPASRGCVLR